ncbi:unnamed protein product [Effrenium voratum]|uniref:S-adenosyl-L-methionine-dependent methyltransferase n=1 Tax=Effrenium voratum TaxID=2562239 RepID=A0AA36JMH5_9DINO|nr:unnamed protein product [Effrenium voratum]CAJ1407739.1 unnamed protein product [Effrenium voratum]CAJ1423350.1 unnamed protein product [Effrenium voratum]
MSDSTAAGVAKIRHAEMLAPKEERIIEDPYAEYFYFGSTVSKWIGHANCVWLFEMLAPGSYEMLVARTRVIDELVKTETAAGVTQVVVLGAGYDMRSFRFPVPGVRFFEVDQPAVQKRKKDKVASIPDLPAANVYYVPVDFSCQSLEEELRKVPDFDVSAKTLVTLEGVSQYISREAVCATIKAIDRLTGAGSTFFLSYVDAQCTEPQKVVGQGYKNPERVKRVAAAAATMGEPWVTFFEQSEVPGILECSRFKLVSDVSTEEISRQYFPASRQVPSEKLLQLERYVVAKK